MYEYIKQRIKAINKCTNTFNIKKRKKVQVDKTKMTKKDRYTDIQQYNPKHYDI